MLDYILPGFLTITSITCGPYKQSGLPSGVWSTVEFTSSPSSPTSVIEHVCCHNQQGIIST